MGAAPGEDMAKVYARKALFGVGKPFNHSFEGKRQSKSGHF
jgi:hypothetical protein